MLRRTVVGILMPVTLMTLAFLGGCTEIKLETNEQVPGSEINTAVPEEGLETLKESEPEVSDEPEEADKMTMNIQIGDKTLTATLVNNSSAEALIALLERGSITINMRDYGNMEKVGMLGTSLPANDEQITTKPGDLILYQENAFVIYYAPNSWNFTRLGKIDDISSAELKEVLGSGDVTVTLSVD